jgi:hypothetical protein
LARIRSTSALLSKSIWAEWIWQLSPATSEGSVQVRVLHRSNTASRSANYLGSPVVFVPGNHEYYRGNFDSDRDRLLKARTANTTALDRGQAFFRSNNRTLRVLGATLWTDYSVFGDAEAAMVEAAHKVPDHTLIRLKGGALPFTPADALLEHQLSRRWLSERLDEKHSGPTLIVTHFVPHPAAHHPGFDLTTLSAAFCSDCIDLIEKAKRADVIGWIFGHHHWSQELRVSDLPLFSAQLGYPKENTNWKGPGVLEI